MSIYKVSIIKQLLIKVVITSLIILLAIYTSRVNNVNINIGILFGGLILLILQLPIYVIRSIAIDEKMKEIIIIWSIFFFWEKVKKFKIENIKYSYKEEYAISISKDKIFTIYEKNKKIFRVFAATVGYRLLDNFVNELENLIADNND